MQRREEWFDGQLDLDPERLVFIDRTRASTNIPTAWSLPTPRAAALGRAAWTMEDDHACT
jgi:hypothetical protein